MNQVLDIAENIATVQERIASACERAGRDPNEITLVAVSKKKPAEHILEAINAGLREFGENRIEEAAIKIPDVMAGTTASINWHMIGHIQRRKVRDVVRLNFDLVHSVDNLKLAASLDQITAAAGRTIPVLLEMNVSGEAAKNGWDARESLQSETITAELRTDIEAMCQFEHLNIQGLMTMAPLVQNAEATRPVFQSLARLRAALKSEFPALDLPHLSMGMTNDYEVAIEEGATIVRIGRAIFGERPNT
jgi:pyridoxal phosphate enzyme (YggS family)